MLRLTLAISVLLLAVGCGGEVSSDPAIYDWEAQRGTTSEHGADDLKCRPEACPDPTAEWVYVFGAPKLAGDDFDRRTIRAAVAPETGEPVDSTVERSISPRPALSSSVRNREPIHLKM